MNKARKKQVQIRLLFIFASVIMILIVILLAIGVPQQNQQQETSLQSREGECHDGDIRECLKGPCNGTQICINGTWGKCDIKRICNPGTKVPCTENYCPIGYKICNECGTGYGPCIYFDINKS